jgi:hypothetical protein
MFSQLAASTPLFASAFVPGLGSPALAPAVEKHVRVYGEISHPKKKGESWVNPLEFKVKSPICIMSSKSADSGPPSPRIHHDLRLAMTCNDLQSTTRWDLSWSITILSSVQRQPLQWQRAKSPQPAAVYGRAEKKDLELSTARHSAESTTRTRDNPVLSSSARMFTHTHILYIYINVCICLC